jgi:pimeloyl-ACP methyl ester carboxylesterase
MTKIKSFDGAKLHCEEAGEGEPILFVHEFAGDCRSWEPQVRFLSRQYRCITFNARGVPPSDVPDDPGRYSQDIMVADAFAVLDAHDIERAHIVSHSMGSYTALHMGLRQPERIASIVTSGVGWGSDPSKLAENRKLALEIADMFEDEPIVVSAARYADFPMRQRFKQSDPEGWRDFADRLAEHSGLGSALTMRHVQATRPTLPEMADDLSSLNPPLLVIVGDEDEACIEGSLLLKRRVPGAGLLMLPWASHTLNSEQPDAFNDAVLEFLSRVAVDG